MRVTRRGLLSGIGLFTGGFLLGDNANYAKRALVSARHRYRAYAEQLDFSPLRPQVAQPTPTTVVKAGLFGMTSDPMDTVRVGIIGVGARGAGLALLTHSVAGAELKAIADLRSERVEHVRETLKARGHEKPISGFSGIEAAQKLLQLDLDLILIATPWDSHTPLAIEAMKLGKHVGIEVPACVTLDEGQALIETSAATGKHCMLLENVCYGQSEQMVLNMVRHGVLGELAQGRAGYSHDLREDLLRHSRHYPPHWRLEQHTYRNGNLYPTHGIGPISKTFGIYETDEIVSLTSFSSAPNSFTGEMPADLGPVIQGDTNTSILTTRKGRVITLNYNVATARPYSRDHTVIGSRGIVEGYPDRFACAPDAHQYKPEFWNEAMRLYQSDMWRMGALDPATKQFHGGMDYFMLLRLIENLRAGAPMDINVYESVLWSILGPLTELSVKKGGAAVEVPDITAGAWKERGGVQALPTGWGVSSGPLSRDLGVDLPKTGSKWPV